MSLSHLAALIWLSPSSPTASPTPSVTGAVAPTDALSVAAINASILAVAAAFAIAYLAFLAQRKETLEGELIEEANAINRVAFPRFTDSTVGKLLHEQTQTLKLDLMIDVHRILAGVAPTETDAERAVEVRGLMSVYASEIHFQRR